MKDFPTLTDGDLTLVPLNLRLLELVRCWRNEARAAFFDSHVIEADEQILWFHFRYTPDLTDYMWVALLNGVPVGTGALTKIDLVAKEAEWSRLMVGEPSARGQGVAGRIARLVRDYGLDILGLQRIYGSLYATNTVTLHIDMAAGYLPYREADGIIYVELLRKDWRSD